MEITLAEEKSGASGRKQTYTYSTPEVRARICKGMDEAESDCDSEDDSFAISVNNRYLTCTTLVLGTT